MFVSCGSCPLLLFLAFLWVTGTCFRIPFWCIYHIYECISLYSFHGSCLCIIIHVCLTPVYHLAVLSEVWNPAHLQPLMCLLSVWRAPHRPWNPRQQLALQILLLYASLHTPPWNFHLPETCWTLSLINGSPLLFLLPYRCFFSPI